MTFFCATTTSPGAAATVPKMSDLTTVKAFLTQPAYTAFWQAMAVEDRLGGVAVPTLEVGGTWDQEDMWGTQAEYAALKQHDDPGLSGARPWDHGGWQRKARRLGSEFGRLNSASDGNRVSQEVLRRRSFEKFLKDRPGFDLADTASFRTRR